MMSSSERSDVSIAGMLQNFCASNFTLQDSLNETLENCKDNCKDKKTSIFNFMLICITTTYGAIKPGKYLVVSNNSKGKTEDDLHHAQEMSNYKDAQQGMHGRFGMGYAVARSVFTQNKGTFLWLSCHSDLTEEEKKDPYISNKFSEISIDMEASIRENGLVRKSRSEIPRCHEKLWEEYAIDPHAQGNVQVFPISDDTYNELKQLYSHPNLEQNYCASISWHYRDYIRAGININIDGKEIEDLPDFDCFTQTHEIYDIPETCLPLTLPTTNDKITTPIDPFVRKTEGKWYVGYLNKSGTYVWKELKDCCQIKNGKIRVKQITAHFVYSHKTVSLSPKDKDKLREDWTPIFKKYGVEVKDGYTSKFDSFVFGDFISRAMKLTKMEKDPKLAAAAHNRDGEAQSLREVINIYEIPTKNETDKKFGIGNNKSEVKRNNIDPSLLQNLDIAIKRGYNKKYFKKEFVKILPKAPTSAPKAPTTASKAPPSASNTPTPEEMSVTSVPKTTAPKVSAPEPDINAPLQVKETKPNPTSYSDRQGCTAHNSASKVDSFKKLRFLQNLTSLTPDSIKELESTLKEILFKVSDKFYGSNSSVFIKTINRGSFTFGDYIETIIDMYNKMYDDNPSQIHGGAEIDKLYKKYCPK